MRVIPAQGVDQEIKPIVNPADAAEPLFAGALPIILDHGGDEVESFGMRKVDAAVLADVALPLIPRPT